MESESCSGTGFGELLEATFRLGVQARRRLTESLEKGFQFRFAADEDSLPGLALGGHE